MKQGKTLEELGKELMRQRDVRKDYISDTRSLEMDSSKSNGILRLFLDDGAKEFTISQFAHQQIATRLGIPYRYYQKMQQSYPALLDENVNGWFAKSPERRMIRTLDGHVRAFLSDRYRRLDNIELCASVIPVIKEMKGASIISCDVTESHLYLKIINKKLKAEMSVGDVVQAGFVISNSEIGLGCLKVEPLIYRLVCKNGLIVKDYSQKKYHVGRQAAGDEETAYEIYSDATLAQDDKAFFMKVQDIVRCAADEAKFAMTVDKLRQTQKMPIGENPVQAVEELADSFLLTENERGDILRQLFMGRDNSRYGLINAITAASQLAKDYERATELERIGGELLSLSAPHSLSTKPTTFSIEKNISPISSQLLQA